jgi:hypothetical protein
VAPCVDNSKDCTWEDINRQALAIREDRIVTRNGYIGMLVPISDVLLQRVQWPALAILLAAFQLALGFSG